MRMQNRLVILAFAIPLSFTAITAHAMSAQSFVTTASIANRFEIDSSKLAMDKSQNNDVKDFAKRMIDDHTKTGNKLQEVLQSSASGIRPAASLDAEHRKLLDELKSASGSAFDHRYIAIQTDAHKQAVQLFSGYSHHGKNAALKRFAAETLPTLQDHLKHVERLKAE